MKRVEHLFKKTNTDRLDGKTILYLNPSTYRMIDELSKKWDLSWSATARKLLQPIAEKFWKARLHGEKEFEVKHIYEIE